MVETSSAAKDEGDAPPCWAEALLDEVRQVSSRLRSVEESSSQLSAWLLRQERRGTDQPDALTENDAFNLAQTLQIPRRSKVDDAKRASFNSNSDVGSVNAEAEEVNSTCARPEEPTRADSVSSLPGVGWLQEKIIKNEMKMSRMNHMITHASSMLESHHKRIKRAEFADSVMGKQVVMKYALVQRFVHSAHFDTLCTLVIVTNALFIGWQTDYNASHMPPMPLYFRYGDWVFCLLFMIELTLRISADGTAFILCREWKWNLFDAVVVLFSVIELLAGLADTGGSDSAGAPSLTFLRVLRILRVVKLIRAIRVFRFFRELRIMVLMIFASLKSLTWVAFLLLIMLFICSIFLTHEVASHLQVVVMENVVRSERQAYNDKMLRYYYGSCFQSALTLYRSMTGGLDWGLAAEPLAEEMSGAWYLFWTLFITFACMAVLNVVTGVFCEHATHVAQADFDFAIQGELDNRRQYSNALKHCFHEADTDKDGLLTLSELRKLFDNVRVVAYLEALELNVQSCSTLFRLIDADGDGTVRIDDFVEGCSKLKGTARSSDVALLKVEMQKLMKRSMTETRSCLEQNAKLVEGIGQLVQGAALTRAPAGSFDPKAEVAQGRRRPSELLHL